MNDLAPTNEDTFRKVREIFGGEDVSEIAAAGAAAVGVSRRLPDPNGGAADYGLDTLIAVVRQRNAMSVTGNDGPLSPPSECPLHCRGQRKSRLSHERSWVARHGADRHPRADLRIFVAKNSVNALEEKCRTIFVGFILRRTLAAGAIRQHRVVLKDMNLSGRQYGRAVCPVGQI